MAFETRRNGHYYYRKHKRAGKVISEYVGTGPFAELAAQRDSAERHKRTKERHELHALQEQQRRLDRLIGEYRRQAYTVVAATLHRAGYHQHNRCEWRKRRGTDMSEETYDIALPDALGVLAWTVEGEILRCAGLGKTPAVAKQLRAEVAGLRTRLGWADAPAHEQLLIERIALDWLRMQLSEQLLSQNSIEANYKLATVEHFERRLAAAHRRFVESVTALARVRKLNIHVQMNIAQQQVVQNG